MIKNALKKIIILYYKMLTRLHHSNIKKAVFISSVGRSILGSPKAICQYMLNNQSTKNIKCYWIVDSTSTKLPNELRACKLVKKNSLLYFHIMATAGIWISDTRLPSYLIKKEDMLYIQTWHGTPLKKLALDMENVFMSEGKSIETYKKEFCANSSTWDCLVSQNSFSTEIFRRCFNFDKKMLEVGYPRNDMLFSHNNASDIDLLKEKFSIPKDKKVFLYAPTWRDNMYHSNGEYKFVSELDFEKFNDAFGKDSILLIKYHYLVKENIDWSLYKDFIKVFKADIDINELYLVSDALITDYSSVMFDYCILKRPMFFFAYDLEDYRDNLRGFYFDFFKEAPGPISTTTKALISDIKNYSVKDWSDKYDAFNKKYDEFENGLASKKIVEYIENSYLKGKN